jgi:hypothetical protein
MPSGSLHVARGGGPVRDPTMEEALAYVRSLAHLIRLETRLSKSENEVSAIECKIRCVTTVFMRTRPPEVLAADMTYFAPIEYPAVPDAIKAVQHAHAAEMLTRLEIELAHCTEATRAMSADRNTAFRHTRDIRPAELAAAEAERSAMVNAEQDAQYSMSE